MGLFPINLTLRKLPTVEETCVFPGLVLNLTEASDWSSLKAECWIKLAFGLLFVMFAHSLMLAARIAVKFGHDFYVYLLKPCFF